MALLLDLAYLSYKGLRRRPAAVFYLLLLSMLCTMGWFVLLGASDSISRSGSSVQASAEGPGLLRLGRAWPGIDRPEMISTGRLSSLMEMLRYLGCLVSPVFICGEDEEKHISIEASDYYIRSGIMGVDADFAEIMGPALQIVDGRFFSMDEMDSAAKVVVIGAAFAALMHESQGSAVSQHISVAGEDYEVVGVVAEGPGYRSQYEDLSVSERIIFPYTALAGESGIASAYEFDLRAVAYKRPDSITDEFVDRVINDWLRRNDLLEGRFISHVRSSRGSLHAGGLAVTGSGETAGVSNGAMSALTCAWVFLFAIVSTASLGYIRVATSAGELRLMQTLGASPLHLALRVAVESLVLVALGSAGGVFLASLLLEPLLESLTGLDLASVSGLSLWVTATILGSASSAAGSIAGLRNI